MTSSEESVILIGLGSMGKTLGHALLKANIKLSVWNRTASRPAVTELVSDGASFEADLATGVSKSSTVIFCVLDYPAIIKLLQDNVSFDALKGKNIVNLTNGTPQEARDMNETMRSRNVAKYVDGGIMVPPQAIATPASFIFISGDDLTSAKELTDLISILGTAHHFGEDPGAAALHDLAVLAGMYGMFGGLVTAIGMMQKQRVKNGEGPAKVEPSIKNFLTPLLQMLLPSQEYIAAATDAGTFAENHGHPMSMMSVSMDNILKACETEGVDGSVMKAFDRLMKGAIAKGGPDCGMAQITTLMSTWT